MSANNPQGSDFARMLLENGFKDITCSVSDYSDDEAMKSLKCVKIASYYPSGMFIDTNNELWLFAVPIKVSRLTQMDL